MTSRSASSTSIESTAFAHEGLIPKRYSCDGADVSPPLAVEGIPGASPAEPIYLDNVGHPAASRLALAKASRSHMHAFGINWDDTSGKNNGHFAPFSWSSN